MLLNCPSKYYICHYLIHPNCDTSIIQPLGIGILPSTGMSYMLPWVTLPLHTSYSFTSLFFLVPSLCVPLACLPTSNPTHPFYTLLSTTKLHFDTLSIHMSQQPASFHGLSSTSTLLTIHTMLPWQHIPPSKNPYTFIAKIHFSLPCTFDPILCISKHFFTVCIYIIFQEISS